MGQTLSRVRGSLVTRSVQRYNIEERTEKLLDRDVSVPRPAPKFKADEEALEAIRVSHPHVREAAVKKDDALHQRLRDVYVTSKDADNFNPDSLRQIENPERPNPRNTTRGVADPESQEGHPFTRPDVGAAARGRIILSTVMDALAEHKENPGVVTAEDIARKHGVNVVLTEGLLRHYTIFDLFQTPKAATIDRRQEVDTLRAGPDWEEVDDKGNVIEEKKKPLPDQSLLLGPKKQPSLRGAVLKRLKENPPDEPPKSGL